MKDDTHTRPMAHSVMEVGEVTRLAQRAIAVLAAHGAGCSDGLAQCLFQMTDAFIDADEEARHDVLLRLRQDSVSSDDLIDHIIPAAARLLGERWFADDISFADVTIGAARLQEAVRALGRRDANRRDRTEQDKAVLLVIPRSEDHTLGSFVLADQIRRLGFAVDVAVDRHPRQLVELLRKRRYHMVGITVSGRRTLVSARDLVDTVRRTATRVTPVVIGGPILDRDFDVLAMTGADHAARDAASALLKCGLLQAGDDTLPERSSIHAGGGVPAVKVDES